MSYETNDLGYDLGYESEPIASNSTPAQSIAYPEKSGTGYYAVKKVVPLPPYINDSNKSVDQNNIAKALHDQDACSKKPGGTFEGGVCTIDAPADSSPAPASSAPGAASPPTPPSTREGWLVTDAGTDWKFSKGYMSFTAPKTWGQDGFNNQMDNYDKDAAAAADAKAKADSDVPAGKASKPTAPAPAKLNGKNASGALLLDGAPTKAAPTSAFAPSYYGHDLEASQALKKKGFKDDEISVYLGMTAAERKQDSKKFLARIEATEPERLKADMYTKDGAQFATFLRDKGFSRDEATKILIDRGILSSNGEGKIDEASWKAKKGPVKLYGVDTDYDVSQSQASLGGLKAGKVKKDELKAKIDADTKRVNEIAAYREQMGKLGYSKEPTDALLRGMKPPLVDDKGHVTEFDPDQAAGYLFEAPPTESKKVVHPVDNAYKTEHDAAVAHLKKHDINPDTFFQFCPPPTGKTEGKDGADREKEFYSFIATKNKGGLEEMMGKGNVRQWLEYERSQGKSVAQAYSKLKAQKVIADDAEVPKDWAPGDSPYPVKALPPAPKGTTLEQLEKSQKDLAKAKGQAPFVDGKLKPGAKAIAPGYTDKDGKRHVLQPGALPPAGAKEDDNPVTKVAVKQAQDKATGDEIFHILHDAPPFGQGLDKKTAYGRMYSSGYFDADGHLKPDADPERVLKFKTDNLEARQRIGSKVFEYDSDGKPLYETDADGKQIPDPKRPGHFIPKMKKDVTELDMEQMGEARKAELEEWYPQAVADSRSKLVGHLHRLGLNDDQIAAWMNGHHFYDGDVDLQAMAKYDEEFTKIDTKHPESAQTKQYKDNLKKETQGHMTTGDWQKPNDPEKSSIHSGHMANLDPKAAKGQGQGGPGGGGKPPNDAEQRQFQKWLQKDQQKFQEKLTRINFQNGIALEDHKQKLELEKMEKQHGYALMQNLFGSLTQTASQVTINSINNTQQQGIQINAKGQELAQAQVQAGQRTLELVLGKLYSGNKPV